jgi:hypothetical protein
MNTFPLPGDRVLCFDNRLYVDDRRTPPSVTIKPATVVQRYGRRSEHFGWTDGDLVDVRFDHDGRISRGHFTDSVLRVTSRFAVRKA